MTYISVKIDPIEEVIGRMMAYQHEDVKLKHILDDAIRLIRDKNGQAMIHNEALQQAYQAQKLQGFSTPTRNVRLKLLQSGLWSKRLVDGIVLANPHRFTGRISLRKRMRIRMGME